MASHSLSLARDGEHDDMNDDALDRDEHARLRLLDVLPSECEPTLRMSLRPRPPRISLPKLVLCDPKLPVIEWPHPATPELPTRRRECEGRVLSEAVMRSAALHLRREKLLTERRDLEIDFIASKLCISQTRRRWFELFPTVAASDESVQLAVTTNPDKLSPPSPPPLCAPRRRRPPLAFSDGACVQASRESPRWPQELPLPELPELATRAFESQKAVRGWSPARAHGSTHGSNR